MGFLLGRLTEFQNSYFVGAMHGADVIYIRYNGKQEFDTDAESQVGMGFYRGKCRLMVVTPW